MLHCAPVSRSKVKVTSSHRLYVSSLPLLNLRNKMLYLCHQRRAGHTVLAEPGGHTSRNDWGWHLCCCSGWWMNFEAGCWGTRRSWDDSARWCWWSRPGTDPGRSTILPRNWKPQCVETVAVPRICIIQGVYDICFLIIVLLLPLLLYSAFIVVPHTQGAQAWITQFHLQITPRLPLPRKR